MTPIACLMKHTHVSIPCLDDSNSICAALGWVWLHHWEVSEDGEEVEIMKMGGVGMGPNEEEEEEE